MRLKRSGIITKLIVLALIVYAAASLISLRTKIDAAKAAQKKVQQQVAAKEIENAQIEYQIEHAEDDEVIADIAREDFGLVKPGEVVYYNGETP